MAKDRVYNNRGGDNYMQALNEVFQPNKYSGPEESNLWYDTTNAKLNTMVSQDYAAPAYEGKYDNAVNTAYNETNRLSRGDYDYAADPQYQAYRKQYLRAGQRATQDTMAAASAMTGGRPSSYAVTAAAQAGNNYAAQLSDKIPELYNQAYNRALQQLQSAQQMQQNDYNRYIQDRTFNYNARQDQINNMMKNTELKYNQRATDRAFNYQQKQDWIHNMQSQEQWEWSAFLQQAQMAFNVGDYKQLEEMGFDTSRSDFGERITLAQLIAQVTGDTSYARELLRR